MNTKFSRYAIISAIAFLPVIAFADVAPKKDLKYLIGIVSGYLNQILLLMMGIAVVIFVFYIIRYFILPNDKRAEAAKYLLWSIIGFFVILTFWGLVNVVKNTFDLDTTKPTSWSDYFNLFPGNSGGGQFNSNTGTPGSTQSNQ